MKISKEAFIKLYKMVYQDNQEENMYKLYIQEGIEEFIGSQFEFVLKAYEMGYNDKNNYPFIGKELSKEEIEEIEKEVNLVKGPIE